MSAPGTFSSTDAASSAVRKSPGTNSPEPSMKKQRSASPSQAMPRSAPVSRTLAMMNSRFSGSSGLGSGGGTGSWGGEPPVGDPWVLAQLEGDWREDRPDHRPRHAVPAVHGDLQRF